ncbi:hypothetical protein LSAT2_023038 [Lamellibrachia satsuma]|nr:hypothetical protein LSAT2_023038 [Lamellibrachia satsuma]
MSLPLYRIRNNRHWRDQIKEAVCLSAYYPCVCAMNIDVRIDTIDHCVSTTRVSMNIRSRPGARPADACVNRLQRRRNVCFRSYQRSHRAWSCRTLFLEVEFTPRNEDIHKYSFSCFVSEYVNCAVE